MHQAAWLADYITKTAQSVQKPSSYLAQVASVRPFMIKVEGEALGAPFLLAGEEVRRLLNTEPPGLQAGDTVLAVPVNGHRQFVAVTRAVSV